MRCVFESYPQASVSWTYNNNPELPSVVKKNIDQSQEDGYHIATSVSSWKTVSGMYDSDREKAGGEYRCTGNTGEHSTAVTYNLNVKCMSNHILCLAYIVIHIYACMTVIIAPINWIPL